MTITAKVIGFNKNIEEEVFLELNGIQLDVFAVFVPYKIYVGEEYPVKLYLFMDKLEPEKSMDSVKNFIKCDQGFGYKITGYLDTNGVFDAGVPFEAEDFQEFSYLYGNYVSFYVDRIDAEFLER